MTTPETFALLFKPESGDNTTHVEAGARVYLCPSILASRDGREDKVFLSKQCLTLSEFRREIDRLQKELELLWNIGRRSFSDFEQLKKSRLERAAS